jgi:dTDP-4-dehydrorhamnose reductase
MKVLVIGSKGQLGSEIQRIAQNYSGYDFLFHDIDTLNLANKNAVKDFFDHYSLDYVINCAAYTAVDKAENDQEAAFLINHQAVANLSQLCKEHDCRLVQVSTDYVFDGKNWKPYTEKDIPNPVTIYGKSKLEGEKELINNDAGIIVRTSWLYSVYGNNFVKTILKLAKERDQLNVVADQVGSPTNAKDLAHAILQIIEKNPELSTDIIHCSNEGVCSWYDFASEIISLSSFKCKINPIETKDYPTPAQRPFYSVLSKTKMKQKFNVKTHYWKKSLENSFDEIGKNINF